MTARCLQSVQRWLALDPLHEPAHRALIRLYADTGDRAAALVQYRECVRALSRELGVPPLPETTALYEQVNRGSYAPARPAPVHPSDAPADAAALRPPFVGRADEPAGTGRGLRRQSAPTGRWPSSRGRPASARPG